MQVDAFCVHERLISDSCSFTEGFVEIHDKRIGEHVEKQSTEGAQWPGQWLEPRLQRRRAGKWSGGQRLIAPRMRADLSHRQRTQRSRPRCSGIRTALANRHPEPSEGRGTRRSVTDLDANATDRWLLRASWPF